MRLLKALTLAAALFAPALAEAQARPVVVELYTSQGCSSCPPADRYLAEIAKRRDVIALSLHVDYWDYMGWKDTFASPDHSKRQRRYAHVQRQRTVYTPQMVIQGVDIVVGSRKRDVEPRLSAHQGHKNAGGLSATRQGNQILVELSAHNAAKPCVVQLVKFSPKHSVKIARGENRGREIVYTNVVDSWDIVGTWNGREAKKLAIKAGSDGSYVVIVQEKGNGPILAAARVN